MLTFNVIEITQGGAGPVVHATSEGGVKLELYLLKGYAVPAIGDVLELVHDTPIGEDQTPPSAGAPPT